MASLQHTTGNYTLIIATSDFNPITEIYDFRPLLKSGLKVKTIQSAISPDGALEEYDDSADNGMVIANILDQVHFGSRFKNVIYFDKSNLSSILPPVEKTTRMLFTDGACSNNGKPTARAGFGVYTNFSACISLPVEKAEYSLVDGKIQTKPEVYINSSNNRAELLGLIYALLEVAKFKEPEIVEIISDSQIYVNLISRTYHSKSESQRNELKNLDLVKIAVELYNQVSAVHTVAITHVRGHKKEPAEGSSQRENDLWFGNQQADLLAVAGTKL